MERKAHWFVKHSLGRVMKEHISDTAIAWQLHGKWYCLKKMVHGTKRKGKIQKQSIIQCFLITLGTEVVLKSYPHRSPFYVISLQSSYGSFLGTTCLTTCLKTSISKGFRYPLRLLLAAKCIPNQKKSIKNESGWRSWPQVGQGIDFWLIFDRFLKHFGEPLGGLFGEKHVKIRGRFLTPLFIHFWWHFGHPWRSKSKHSVRYHHQF